MKITFMRHAESEHNAKGLLAGLTDITCTESGISKARTLAEKYDGKFDAYYTSPLTRTRQTAAAVAPNANFIIDNRLIERNMGAWENMRFTDIGRQQFIDVLFYDAPMEGCETIVSATARLADFFEFLKKKHASHESIFAVSHGGVLIALQQEYAKNQKIPENLETITIEI